MSCLARRVLRDCQSLHDNLHCVPETLPHCSQILNAGPQVGHKVAVANFELAHAFTLVFPTASAMDTDGRATLLHHFIII